MGLLDAVKQRIIVETAANTEKAGSNIAKYAKLVAGVGAAALIAKKGFKDFVDFAQAESANTKFSVEQLQKASQGLISEFDLLQLAGAAANTEFQTTQDELNEVAEFMIRLRNEGNDLTKVQTNLTKAIVEGNARGLREFGVFVEGATGKAETHRAILDKIIESNIRGGKVAALAGDDIQRLGIDMEDAGKRWSAAIGEIVTAMGALAEGIADVIGGVADLIKNTETFQRAQGVLTRFFKSQVIDMMQTHELVLNSFRIMIEAGGVELPANLRRTVLGPELDRGFTVSATGELVSLAERADERKKPKKKRGKRKKPVDLLERDAELFREFDEFESTRAEKLRELLAEDPIFETTALEQTIAEGIKVQRELAKLVPDAAEIGRLELDIQAIQKAAEAADAVAFEKRENVLARIFGDTDQFSIYAEGFDLVVGASQAAFKAWIDGSQGAGEAVKQFANDFLSSMAVEMLGNAIRHGAMALGSVAFGDPRGAITHGIAAAKFAAGAAAIGGLAAGIARTSSGGAGAGASGGGSSGAVSGLAGGGGEGGGRHITVILGNDFEESSPRRRKARLRGALRSAGALREDGAVILR